MKILLTLFVLLLSSSVLAEDISDFQIEGMSIGDSLINYYSEERISNSKIPYFENERQYYIFHFHLLFKVFNKANVRLSILLHVVCSYLELLSSAIYQFSLGQFKLYGG